MPEDRIGQWFAVVYKTSRFTISKYHRIDSTIEDRLVTNCGRQMRTTRRKKYEDIEYRSPDRPTLWSYCMQCQGY